MISTNILASSVSSFLLSPLLSSLSCLVSFITAPCTLVKVRRHALSNNREFMGKSDHIFPAAPTHCTLAEVRRKAHSQTTENLWEHLTISSSLRHQLIHQSYFLKYKLLIFSIIPFQRIQSVLSPILLVGQCSQTQAR